MQVKVAAKADSRLFTAFALLNAVGYNSENGWLFSEVRRTVRLRLANRFDFWRSSLGDAGLLEPVKRAGGAMLMDVVPFLSPPPDFILQAQDDSYLTSWQRKSRTYLQGIEHFLQRFFGEDAVSTLWTEQTKAYEQAVDMLHRLCDLVEVIADHFDAPSSGELLNVLLFPNLLDARGRGYSLSTSQYTYIFIGSVEDTYQVEELVVHELLHRWVDAGADRIVGNGDDSGPMRKMRAQFPIVAESYPDLSVLISETVVRAATAWLMQTLTRPLMQSPAQTVAFCEQIGFIGIQDVYRLLAAEPERPLQNVIQDAIELVHRRVSIEQR